MNRLVKKNKMLKKLRQRQKCLSPIIFLFLLIALISGCASHKADVKAKEDRRITGIRTSEDSESFKVTIKGDRYLIYSAVTQVAPRGVILHFPDTVLENIETIYAPPDNEIISSIQAREIVAEKTTKSSIFIALKKKTPYDLTPMGAEMQISFSKAVAPSKEVIQPKTLNIKKAEPAITPINPPVAKSLRDVMVATLEDNLIVSVKADGVIKNYDSFALSNPARIVIDMYHLKSPYADEQAIAVESNSVNQVRHCVHPDKVRLVLDTNKVASYEMTPMETGLQISVPDRKAAIKSLSAKTKIQLESVTVTALQNDLAVHIKADGVIKDYESFTLDDPPRIIFDIYDMKSPYETEQIIAVDSQWVHQVRHCLHPDKVRLVLDTHQSYLNNYSTAQGQNGLSILIGSVPGSQTE